MSRSTIAFVALAASAAAFPMVSKPIERRAVDWSQWAPAGPGDVRGPCPGLNTLANYGVIPHDGKGLTVPSLIEALTSGFNLGIDAATAFAVGGLMNAPDPLSGKFDLDSLNKHNGLEHDASLAHDEYGISGDTSNFNQTLFDEMMNVAYGNAAETTMVGSAIGHIYRVKEMQANDPTFVWSTKSALVSMGETLLYLTVLGASTDSSAPNPGVVPTAWVRMLFEQEKLPIDQGWQPRTKQITLFDINAPIPSLLKAAGESLPEGLALDQTEFAKLIMGLEETANDSVLTPLKNIIGWVADSALNKLNLLTL